MFIPVCYTSMPVWSGDSGVDRTTTYQCVTPACMVWRQWRGQNNNIPVCYTSLYGLETVAWTEQQHTSVLHQPVWSGDSGVDRTTTYQCVTPACLYGLETVAWTEQQHTSVLHQPVWSGDSGVDGTTTYQCVTPACMVWRQWRGRNNNIPVCYTSLYGLETVAWTEQQHTSVLHQPVWSGDSGVDRTTTYQCVTPACLYGLETVAWTEQQHTSVLHQPVWSGDSGVDGTTTYQCVTPACMVWRQWRGRNNNIPVCYTSLYGLETVAWTEQQHTSVLHQPVWSGDSGVDGTTTYQCVTPACLYGLETVAWTEQQHTSVLHQHACMVWRQWRGRNNNNRSCKCSYQCVTPACLYGLETVAWTEQQHTSVLHQPVWSGDSGVDGTTTTEAANVWE